ncbi:hypothetical protein HDU76_007258 [Blyttiomyces sp. JEL0837]|nr:hypothetical protein HDU76_007258 [Blyttiomyces sp. JEL0837]
MAMDMPLKRLIVMFISSELSVKRIKDSSQFREAVQDLQAKVGNYAVSRFCSNNSRVWRLLDESYMRVFEALIKFGLVQQWRLPKGTFACRELETVHFRSCLNRFGRNGMSIICDDVGGWEVAADVYQEWMKTDVKDDDATSLEEVTTRLKAPSSDLYEVLLNGRKAVIREETWRSSSGMLVSPAKPTILSRSPRKSTHVPLPTVSKKINKKNHRVVTIKQEERVAITVTKESWQENSQHSHRIPEYQHFSNNNGTAR